ncbi:MAG: tetratricopeptide repeat protein [Myxococcales bacterium]|nr:tetratricopeptide repeat protein [Myxococcales bacterium]MCB9530313.1 tetratricopeptide repeat protein [Myxococcales bacterium]
MFVQCVGCGKNVSHKAPSCPFCGTAVELTPSERAAPRGGETITRFCDHVQVAQECVDTFAQHGIVLEFSFASVAALDEILNDLFGAQGVSPHTESWRPDEADRRMIAMVGSYVGELLRRTLGGDWSDDPDHVGKPLYVRLDLGEGGVIWPLERAYRRLKDGEMAALSEYVRRVQSEVLGGPIDQDAVAWANQASDFLKLDRLETAATFADRALTIDPNLSEGWYCRGVVAERRGRKVDATFAFEQARKFDLAGDGPFLAHLDERIAALRSVSVSQHAAATERAASGMRDSGPFPGAPRSTSGPSPSAGSAGDATADPLMRPPMSAPPIPPAAAALTSLAQRLVIDDAPAAPAAVSAPAPRPPDPSPAPAELDPTELAFADTFLGSIDGARTGAAASTAAGVSHNTAPPGAWISPKSGSFPRVLALRTGGGFRPVDAETGSEPTVPRRDSSGARAVAPPATDLPGPDERSPAPAAAHSELATPPAGAAAVDPVEPAGSGAPASPGLAATIPRAVSSSELAATGSETTGDSTLARLNLATRESRPQPAAPASKTERDTLVRPADADITSVVEVETLTADGRQLSVQGRFEEAAACFRRALELEPWALNASLGLATALMALSRAEDAVAALEPLVEGRNPATLALLARAHAALDDHESATRVCDLALRVQPDRVDVWILHGHSCAALGRNDEAIRAFSRALALDGSRADGWRGLATVAATAGDHARARLAWVAYLGLEHPSATASIRAAQRELAKLAG